MTGWVQIPKECTPSEGHHCRASLTPSHLLSSDGATLSHKLRNRVWALPCCIELPTHSVGVFHVLQEHLGTGVLN